MSKRFVSAPEICSELGVCRRTLARMIDDGRFPRPLRLGLRRFVWLRTEYEQHVEQAAVPEQAEAENS